MYIKYELWETETGPMLFPSWNTSARKALYAENRRVCLMVFTAASWDEACQRMHDYFRWEPYQSVTDTLLEQELKNVRAEKFSYQTEVLNFACLAD